MRKLLISIFALSMLALTPCLSAQEQGRPTMKQVPLKVLVLSPSEQRGKAYKDLFVKNGLTCDVVGYDKVTAADMASHDVVIADSADPTFDQYKQRSQIDFKALPKTDKPIIGMGYYGYYYLRKYEIALGLVKT